MKKHFPKIIAVTLGVAALAVSVPVSAFAKSSKPLSYLYTYQLTFDGYDTMSLSPDDSGTITAPALPEGAPVLAVQRQARHARRAVQL